MRVGEIEPQRRLKGERQFFLGAVDAHRHQFGELEHIAGEGRLGADAQTNRRRLALHRDRAALTLGFFRVASALRQFVHDLLRQSRRQPDPAFRQQIDEQPLAGHHRIDRHLDAERQSHRQAVGIAPRRVDVGRRADRNAVDRDVHRALEGDDQNAVIEPHLRLGLFREAEHKPGMAAAGAGTDLGPHARRAGRDREQQ